MFFLAIAALVFGIGYANIDGGEVTHDTHDHTLTEKNISEHRTFELQDRKGRVHVLVRNDGHLIGMPYVVEIRPACGADADKEVEELLALDSQSACDVKVTSTKLAKSGNEIFVQIKEVDSDLYNDNSIKNLKSNKPKCKDNYTTFRFNIADFCKIGEKDTVAVAE